MGAREREGASDAPHFSSPPPRRAQAAWFTDAPSSPRSSMAVRPTPCPRSFSIFAPTRHTLQKKNIRRPPVFNTHVSLYWVLGRAKLPNAPGLPERATAAACPAPPRPPRPAPVHSPRPAPACSSSTPMFGFWVSCRAIDCSERPRASPARDRRATAAANARRSRATPTITRVARRPARRPARYPPFPRRSTACRNEARPRIPSRPPVSAAAV